MSEKRKNGKGEGKWLFLFSTLSVPQIAAEGRSTQSLARKGGPEGPAGKVKTQSDEGRRRTFLARPFMPMGEQGEGTRPCCQMGGMVGQRRPGDVYKMRLQIGVHNGAFCCSGTLMKRRKFNGGKRCRLAFHAVDRGSNPLGDANIRYNKGYQCAKHIGILSFFVSTGFPVVHVCPVASNACRGISEGRSMV